VLESEPSMPTAIPARCRFTLDLRHADGAVLTQLEADALTAIDAAAAASGCTTAAETLWAIEPIRFDAALTGRAAAAAGHGTALVSGPLHDSAALAQAGIPATMLFASSIGGVSHTRAEDTPERDLEAALETFGALVVELAATA
ncbi:MAG TPA: hypothetical protein VN238_12875, partial [Solirubrobacteraceae bacterium]|nr:hypothetical protein [Solirubrobacteraceae bacterium]